jgi:signal transduction histidine kinase
MVTDSLKIALRNQRRIILLFGLTVLCPAIFMSILGVRGMRNEKFRKEREVEGGARKILGQIEETVRARCDEAENRLREVAERAQGQEVTGPPFLEFARGAFMGDPLIEQAFVVTFGEPPVFLMGHPPPFGTRAASFVLSDRERTLLEEAESAEYRDRDYAGAASLYEQILISTADRDLQALVLNNIGRCWSNIKDYPRATAAYTKILKEYPGARDEHGLPLDMAARLRRGDLFLDRGDFLRATELFLDAYRFLLEADSGLAEEQFRAYAELASEKIASCLGREETESARSLRNQFQKLKSAEEEKLGEWTKMSRLKSLVIPELGQKVAEAGEAESGQSQAIRFSKALDDRTHLVLAAAFPGQFGIGSPGRGFIGAEVSEDSLISGIVEALAENRPSFGAELRITDPRGGVLWGSRGSNSRPLLMEYFKEDFPPWKIEVLEKSSAAIGFFGGSFYFWAILLTLLVLLFGTAFVVRAIVREVELLNAKSQFIAAVSHDLKSPLSSAKVLIERLEAGRVRDAERIRQYISAVAASVDQLTRLVNNILDFSKIEEAKKTYQFEKSDLARLVREECATFVDLRGRDNIQVKVEVHDPIPIVDIDSASVRQALANLLDNAAKFSPERRGIDVEAESDGSSVRISVRDHGIGIASEERDKIFEKYYRGKNASAFSPGGAGLGLTLVNEVMRAHGGRVTVESETGTGSTFTLIFPLARS